MKTNLAIKSDIRSGKVKKASAKKVNKTIAHQVNKGQEKPNIGSYSET